MGKSKKVKHKIFLQYGEILEKEYAAVNTITTMLWGIPQNVFTTHISPQLVPFPKRTFHNHNWKIVHERLCLSFNYF